MSSVIRLGVQPANAYPVTADGCVNATVLPSTYVPGLE